MKIKEKHKVIEQINLAFGRIQRPKEFVDVTHCDECKEHNETLLETNCEEIGLKELGNPGWDPICFVRPQGFLYYFPALVRLVFDDKSNNEFLDSFLFHSTYEGVKSRFFVHFNEQQISATLDLMLFLKFNWKKKVEKMGLVKELAQAVTLWEKINKQKERR
jgi:hypothetical protein